MDPILSSALATIDQIKFFTTITLKGEIPEDARFYQTSPGTAHIEWLVGHVAYAIDRLGMSALEGPSAMPDSFQPLFGFGTKPVTDRTCYPSWEETTGHLTATIDRLKAHVSAMTAAQLARPLPESHPFGKRILSQDGMVSFIGFHTCYHLGQVSLLRRAQGLPSGMSL